MANTKKTLESLFISKVRIKSLKYFFFHPDVPIHLRAAVRELGEEINAVRRELQRLEECHVLRTEKRGNRKYFSLNFSHPFFSEMLAIFHKTYGLGGEIIRNSNKIGEIEFAILTSSYTRGVRVGVHDVDLVIIGNIDLAYLSETVSRMEKQLNREINYTVLKKSEFDVRKKRRDPFVAELLVANKILLMGNHEELVS